MEENTSLNVLGCFPEGLNMLFELADESKNIRTFNILKNIPVENPEFYVPNKKYQVNTFNCYESHNKFNHNDGYVFSVVGTKSKEIVFNYFKQKIQIENKQFLNLIHPTAFISGSTHFNYGIQVESMCSISVLSNLGFGVNIKRNCSIGHHCSIGNFVTINPGVTICGFVKIGKNTAIGAGTSIKDGVTIGANSIIGIGSVVVKDIPDNSVAYGNPCKVHRKNG